MIEQNTSNNYVTIYVKIKMCMLSYVFKHTLSETFKVQTSFNIFYILIDLINLYI